MESKLFWFGTIFLILIIGTFTYLNRAQAETDKTETFSDTSCQNLIYSGNDRIDLLFISSKQDAQEYSDLFFETQPYKEYKDYFNVNFIEGENPICESYKGIAILCDTKEVKEIARRCEHDYILVVKDEPAHIRSSAYSNVISLNKNADNSVLIHEFGHAFGGLAEEYTPARVPRGAKNCQKSCDKFNDLADSCTKECSESGLFRSIVSGVMRTLSTTNYGQYNIEIIKEILEKNKPSQTTLTGNQIVEQVKCSEEYLVPIDIIQTDGSIEVESTNELIVGCSPKNLGYGETCANDLCYNLEYIFTDIQEEGAETLSGEVLSPPEKETIFVPSEFGEVSLTNNGNLISVINTIEAGATACIVN